MMSDFLGALLATVLTIVILTAGVMILWACFAVRVGGVWYRW